MKYCSKCNTNKDYSQFHKQASAKDGYHYWCKECRSNYDSQRYDKKRKYPKIEYNDKGERQCRKCSGWFKPLKRDRSWCQNCIKEYGLATNLYKYKMTPEEYLDMFEKQGGVCAVCKKPESQRKRLAVDHDHSCCPGPVTCGKCVRGLVCRKCNVGLGCFDDDAELIFAAYEYLNSFWVIGRNTLTRRHVDPSTR